MTLLPLGEIAARAGLTNGVPGAVAIVQHLALWVAFLGAALAAREGKLLALATGQLLAGERAWARHAAAFAAAVGALVTILLADAGLQLVALEREFGDTIAGNWPRWPALIVMPASLAAIALRMVWRAGPRWVHRGLAALGLLTGAALAVALRRDELFLAGSPVWPWLAAVAAATALGGPLFVALGGTALFLFLVDGTSSMALPVETLRMADSPHLPAIPLFTLAGFRLGEGGAPRRLLRVFQALFGWMPGGTAVVSTVLCAFLTVFTGGSGVTILVAGGLLLTALRADGYPSRFSLGLLTASGSLGLLLPPALPLILYGIVAQVPIEDLFRGGLLPGIALVTLLALWGVRQGWRSKVKRRPFHWGEAGAALWHAKYELALPVVVLAALSSGLATLMEAAALTAAYAFVAQVLVHRDVRWRESGERAGVLGVFRDCGVLVGGVLLILAMAMGFTSWIVIEEIPTHLVRWAQAWIESPVVFLLCLNVFLLAVGCLMDVFSATVVVVPLIVPLGQAFGIDPVHLGIIFIANLELGYLTPPVGLNLFLASYRFEQPLVEIYRAALPFLLILGIGVLLITYCPPLSTMLVGAQ